MLVSTVYKGDSDSTKSLVEDVETREELFEQIYSLLATFRDWVFVCAFGLEACFREGKEWVDSPCGS